MVLSLSLPSPRPRNVVLMLFSSPWLDEWWTKLFFLVIRPMIKWLLHKVTGKCELLRISYGQTDNVKRTKEIEDSLKLSNVKELKALATGCDYDVEESGKLVMTKKYILPEVHNRFEDVVKGSLHRIKAYNSILKEAEALRTTKVSSEERDHEDRIIKLWSLYQENVPLPDRFGEHWGDLGFQGHDPQTDFRGMGLLGLEQLRFFAATYPQASKHVLSQAHHPQYGFSFAIVSINLTEMAYTLLSKRKLRSHFYAIERKSPDLNDFHQVHSYLLYEFAQFWISEKPRDIMEFSRLRKKFKSRIQTKLKSQDSILQSSFQSK